MIGQLQSSQVRRWVAFASLTLLSLLLAPAAASAAMKPSPASVDFGDVDRYQWTSSTQVTFTNAEPDQLEVYDVMATGSDFRLGWSDCAGRIYWEGSSCSVDIEVSPTRYGPITGTLTLQTGDGDVEVPLSANVVAGSVRPSSSTLEIYPAPWFWGSQTQRLDLYADGFSVDIGAISIDGPDAELFQLDGDWCGNSSIAPWGSCNIGVRFNPTGPTGRARATLEIDGTGTNMPLSIPITATALTGPVTEITPSEHDFGTVEVGQASDPQIFTVANRGDSPLQIQQLLVVSSSSGMFPISADRCQLVEIQPGESCTFAITFSPRRIGDVGGSVFVITNSPSGVQTIDISGRALPAPGAIATLSGEPRVGEEMRCETTDVIGEPSYGWLRAGVPIAGADRDRYELAEADLGARIACRVTVTNGVGAEVVTSPESAPVAARDLSFQSRRALDPSQCRVVRLPALSGVRASATDPATTLSPLVLRSDQRFEIEIGSFARGGRKVALSPRALSTLPDGASPIELDGSRVGRAILSRCRLAAEVYGSKRSGMTVGVASADALSKVTLRVPKLRFRATKGFNGRLEIVSGAKAGSTVLPIAGRRSTRDGVKIELRRRGIVISGLPAETGSLSLSLEPHLVSGSPRTPALRVAAVLRDGASLSAVGRALWRR